MEIIIKTNNKEYKRFIDNEYIDKKFIDMIMSIESELNNLGAKE